MITIANDIVVSETPHRGQWEKFVLEHPRGNIFQSPAMADLLRTVPNYNPGVITVKERDVLKGVLCYNIISEPSFRQRLTMRSIISGGPLVVNNSSYYASILLKRYEEITEKKPVIYTQVRNLFSVSPLNNVFEEAGYAYEDHLNIHIDLAVSPEEILGQMHRKRSANIRRAQKKQIEIRPITGDEEMHAACRLVTKTYNRINLPSPPCELFLNANYMLQKNVFYLGAFHGTKMIGCRAYLLFKDVMYDWYAASDLDFSNLHPNDLLPWKAMLWGREHGMSTYDFAGAGKPGKPYGVRDYKMRFGGTLYNFGRYTLVHRPWLFRLGKLGMSIYKYIQP
jgi:serine/alanine adding enzyme